MNTGDCWWKGSCGLCTQWSPRSLQRGRFQDLSQAVPMFNHPKHQFFLLVFTWSFPCYIHFLTPSLSRGWRPHPAAPSAFPASGWAKLGSVAPVQAGTPGPEHLHSLQFAMSHREGQALSMVCWGEHNSKQIGNDTNTMFRDYRVQMLRNIVNSMAKQTCYTSTALTITPAALLILILIFFPPHWSVGSMTSRAAKSARNSLVFLESSTH